MESRIVVIKPKSLTPKDKFKLSKKGFTVIECADHIGGLNFKEQSETIKYEFINCANCGERIYMTIERVAVLRVNKRTFYCAQGHLQSFTES